MSTRQISLKHFAAHCAAEINAARNDGSVLELLNAGRVVAVVSPAPVQETYPADDRISRGAALMSYGPDYDSAAPPASFPPGTLAEWRGTGSGFTLPPGSNLDDPAWRDDEWEAFSESGSSRTL